MLFILFPLDLAPLEDIDQVDVGDLIYPLFLPDLLEGDAILRFDAPVGELSILVCWNIDSLKRYSREDDQLLPRGGNILTENVKFVRFLRWVN